jgi:hypothetical protein
MTRARVRQEVRQMRFEELYERRQRRTLTMVEAAVPKSLEDWLDSRRMRKKGPRRVSQTVCSWQEGRSVHRRE